MLRKILQRISENLRGDLRKMIRESQVNTPY
jgi:hypothetical protein